MIGRPAGCLGSNPVKAELAQIELVYKHINHPNRIVLVDPVLQAFRGTARSVRDPLPQRSASSNPPLRELLLRIS